MGYDPSYEARGPALVAGQALTLAAATIESAGARFRLLIALRQFLDRPFVAIWIAEVHKPAPRQVLDTADLNAPPGELLMRLFDVRHHHLKPFE